MMTLWIPVTRCLALIVAVVIHQTAGVRTTGLLDLKVISNQAPEAFSGNTLTVNEGSRLTLTCSAAGSDPRRVFWFEGTHELLSPSRQEVDGTHFTTFTLDPVKDTDDGRVLACRVDSSTQYDKVTLKVQKIRHRGLQMHISSNQPEAFSSEEIVKVNLGTKLELTCILHGVDPHRLSWWHGKERITANSEMNRNTAASSLIMDPVVAADHLKTVTCRTDGSTMTRTVRLEVQGIPEDHSQEETSVLDNIGKDRTLQVIFLSTALFCAIVLTITCVILIKTMQAYIKVREEYMKKEQQNKAPSSSPNRRRTGQQKAPAMKQSLENQILVSASRLPRSSAPEAVTGSADQMDTTESAPLNQDMRQDGENNSAFVEIV